METVFKALLIVALLAIYLQEYVKPELHSNAMKLKGALVCQSSDPCPN